MLVLALAVTSTGASPLGALGNLGPFSLAADRLIADLASRTYVAEGNAILRRDTLVVRADRLELQQSIDVVTAEGNVLIIEGTSVLSCERVALRIPGLTGVIEGAEIRVSRGISPEAFTSASLQGRAAGQTTMRLTSERLERTGDRSFDAEDVWFTPCRCAEDETPSWSISASSASVDLDSGAWLSWPVFYAKDVPVMALPAFYVPLGARRSGLLLPSGERSAPKGFGVTLPLYLTFGRSFDATVEGRVWSARGPAPGLELRWAPGVQSRGEAHATVLFDRGVLGEDGWSWASDETRVRFAVSAEHHTRGEDSQLAAEVNLVGDRAYLAEFGDRWLTRQVEETVSRITWSSSFEREVRVAAGLALRQDLRNPTGFPVPLPDLIRAPIFDRPDARYRFAELRLDAPPLPLSPSAPWLLGDARLTVHGFFAPDRFTSSFARVDFRPAITVAATPLGLASVSSEVALRLTGWSGEGGGGSGSKGRIAVVLQNEGGIELSRRFGTIEHRIRPTVLHVLVPVVAGDGFSAFTNRDEIDLLAPVHQIAAQLETDLWSTRLSRRLLLLRGRLGRDLDFDTQGFGTSELLLDAELELPLEGAVRSEWSARAAIDVERGLLDELVARTELSLGPALRFSAAYGEYGPRPPRYAFAGAEELVPSNLTWFQGYGPLPDQALLVWRAFRGVTASALFRPITQLALGVALGVDLDGTQVDHLRYLETSASWTSSCECWGARVAVARSRDREGIDVHFGLDLAQLGGVEP